MAGHPTQLLHFGPYHIHVAERVLRRDDEVVPLTAKVFDTLLVLVQHRGAVLEKEDLMQKLWPDTVVEESNLTVNMSALRKVLGDSSSNPRYIETLPRRGYRFVAEVHEEWNDVVQDTPAERSLHTFVGRENELDQLSGWLRQAVAGGGGRTVFLTGEPGIGKTALAEAFLSRAQAEHPAVVIARGRCLEQYGTGEAYLPFLDAIGGLLAGPKRARVSAALLEHAPTWCVHFPRVFGGGTWERLQRETIGATKERMLREFGDALGALAANTPTVVLLEDLHWADSSSCELLRRLCQDVGRRHWLLLGTFRPEGISRSDHPLRSCHQELRTHRQCEEIALGLLSHAYIGRYLDVRFEPHDFPPQLATLIHGKTEGHPLFAISLVQLLVERGDLAQPNAHWTLVRPLSELDLAMPEGVRTLIRKKVESLEPDDRRTLEYASIEGEEFTSVNVAALLGIDEVCLQERLQRLDTVHRLIDTRAEEELPDGALTTRYRFAHVLYQNHLYGEVVSRRRLMLHQQTGEQLVQHYGAQAPRIAGQLAMHFERGRDFARAIEYLQHAGNNARAVYANDEALEHYNRALALVPRLPLDDRATVSATLYHRRGQVHHEVTRFEAAVEDYSRGLEHARAAGLDAAQGVLLIALCHTLFFAHRLDDMSVRAEEALQLAERTGDEPIRIEALAAMGRRNISIGKLAEARRLLDESIAGAIVLNHRSSMLAGVGWRGFQCFLQSEYERAEATLTEALSLAKEAKFGFMVLFCLYFLGLTRGNLGRISEALATLDELSQMAKRNGERHQAPKIPNAIGWLHRELGDLDGALRHDRAGVEMSRAHGVLEAEINSTINVGLDHALRGEAAPARSALVATEAMLAQDEWLAWRFGLRRQAAVAQQCCSSGDALVAERESRELLARAQRYEAHKYAVIARTLLAEIAMNVGNLETAERELSSAVEELRCYPAPLVAWKTHVAHGRLRMRMGDTAAAHGSFAEAAALVRYIADHIDEQSLRQRFVDHAASSGVAAV